MGLVMNVRKSLKRATLGLLGAGLVSLGGQTASAIDLFKKGCCNNGGSAWVSHSTPHAVPIRNVGYPAPVAYGYQYVPVPAPGPSIAVRRQLPGSPPDPVPKWARPPGTVPVLAVQTPDPRWVHPSALRGYQAAPAPTYVGGVPGYGPAAAPYGAPAMNAPQQMPLSQPGFNPAQPLPAGSFAPGVPMTSRLQTAAPIVLTQGSDVDSLLDSAQPDPGPAPAGAGAAGNPAAQPNNAQPMQPMQPVLPTQPAPGALAPAPQWQPGFGPAQPAPFQSFAPPPSAYAPVPNPNVPYVAAPQPYGPQGGRGNPAHNSKVYSFDDSGKRPPGTLGKTYLRPTRMIDWDKHPRVGQLDVEVLDTLRHGLRDDVYIKITSRDIYNHFEPLEGFLGEDDVWHFESEPLLPTVPHIYDVKFELVRERTEYERRYGRLFERVIEDKLGTLGVRRIRLIPGRIVDLVLY